MLGCFSHVLLFATLWTAAHQTPLTMGFARHRILERVAMPSSRGSSQPTQGSNLSLLCLLHWQVASLPLVPPFWSQYTFTLLKIIKNPRIFAYSGHTHQYFGFPRWHY